MRTIAKIKEDLEFKNKQLSEGRAEILVEVILNSERKMIESSLLVDSMGREFRADDIAREFPELFNIEIIRIDKGIKEGLIFTKMVNYPYTIYRITLKENENN